MTYVMGTSSDTPYYAPLGASGLPSCTWTAMYLEDVIHAEATAQKSQGKTCPRRRCSILVFALGMAALTTAGQVYGCNFLSRSLLDGELEGLRSTLDQISDRMAHYYIFQILVFWLSLPKISTRGKLDDNWRSREE